LGVLVVTAVACGDAVAGADVAVEAPEDGTATWETEAVGAATAVETAPSGEAEEFAQAASPSTRTTAAMWRIME
jgi:hypothetical protein